MRWLSRGKVLERFVTIHKEVREFLIQRKHTLADNLADQKWLLLVAYLSDIFYQLNILNQSLQESNIMLVNVSEKLLTSKKKVELVEEKGLKKSIIFCFSVFNQFLKDMEEVCLDDVQIAIKRHLAALLQKFDLIIHHRAKEFILVKQLFENELNFS